MIFETGDCKFETSTMYEFDTRAIHAGQSPKKEKFRPVVPPIYYSGNEETYENSTLKSLEECVASLEHGKYALCYPSGLAAVTSVTQTLKDGDHVIVFDSVYHGTRSYLKICEDLGKLKVSFVDLRDYNVLPQHLSENTKMVWIETPCNPTMKIVDIRKIADIVKQRENIFLVVDNTFMSPYFQNPLLLGADIVMHSMTKYMNGHADVLMGAVATNSDEIYGKLKETRDEIGSVPSPMECFLANRGLKTLHVRMQKHMENALEIAQYLEKHPKVEKVFHPGLKSHPQHQVAQRQCRGFSGMVSFCIKGGSVEATTLVQNLKIFIVAVSLGSLESLIEIPSLMTASALTKEKRKELEISDNLIRVSVGLESAKDLIDDLEQAFEKV